MARNINIENPLRGRPVWQVLLIALAVLVKLCEEGEAPGIEAQIQFAYLDPGVGSLLIQGLIAVFAAGAVALRVYWDKIKRLLGFPTAQAEEDDTERKPASDE